MYLINTSDKKQDQKSTIQIITILQKNQKAILANLLSLHGSQTQRCHLTDELEYIK